jgi:branched-chain amino acid transport system permease protein
VLVITGLLFLVFNHTKLGLAMRAVASNAESSKLIGIRTSTVLMASWGIAAAIGALGGVVFAGINTNVNLGLMFTVFIYASAAATLGGFDSPGGAVIGGLAIGVIQNMAAGYADEWVGQEMKVGVAFLVIVAVLLVKPSGLFGTSKVERV